MKKLSIAFFALMLLNIGAFSQTLEKCGTMHNHNKMLENNPALAISRLQVEQLAKNWLNNNPAAKKTVATIPVVFHVVYAPSIPEQNVPDSIIYSQLRVMNEDYRRTNPDTVNTRAEFDSLATDVEIEFCLATVDPSGNFTTGINRVSTSTTNFAFSPFNNSVKSSSTGGVDPWPTTDYLNIWVCDMYFGGSPLVLGYAQFPGDDPTTDGLVLTYQHTGYRPWDAAANPANLGRTASHEIGHYFGLRHIWGDGDCDSTDYVTDTPNAAAASQQICTLTNNTCNDTLEPFWNGYDPPDMLENYMDYSTDACMNMFTKGQKDRMWSFLNTARASLLTSNKCMATLVSEILPSASLIVYPNPASTGVTLEWPGEYNFERLEVLDVVGKVMLTKNITNVYAKYVLNTTDLTNGIYFVRLTDGTKTTTKKILISK
ncbi:MAG: M43 family zinc metalloprotease [Flavobacteriales bacterium]